MIVGRRRAPVDPQLAVGDLDRVSRPPDHPPHHVAPRLFGVGAERDLAELELVLAPDEHAVSDDHGRRHRVVTDGDVDDEEPAHHRGEDRDQDEDDREELQP